MYISFSLSPSYDEQPVLVTSHDDHLVTSHSDHLVTSHDNHLVTSHDDQLVMTSNPTGGVLGAAVHRAGNWPRAASCHPGEQRHRLVARAAATV